MTLRPDSNLPPGSQEWRRAMERENDELRSQISALTQELDRLANSDGGQAQLYATLLTGPIQLLQDQITTLYTATGNTYPPTPKPPPVKPVVPTYKTIETGCVWSRTWGSSTFYTGTGHYTDAGMLYQGSNPENKIGMWGIDMGEAIGKPIIDMKIFVQNTDYPWSSGGIAAFGTHSYASPPSGKPGRQNGFDVGWGEGEGKYASVPSAFYPGFSNGTFRGFTVGGIGPNDPQSAIFAGYGKPYAPRTQITFRTS